MYDGLSKGWGLCLVALLGACGGDDECGPNGFLHVVGPGGTPHCDCDDGYEIRDGTCVEEQSDPPSLTNPGPGTDPGLGTDREPAPDCGDFGSYNGRTCVCDAGYTQTGAGSARTCEAIPQCEFGNDGYEPNDEPDVATALSDVEGSLYACPGDVDWYVFPVVPGDRVSVEIRFDGSAVDLDLLLFGPSSRDPLDASVETESDVESAQFIARAEGIAGALVLPYGIGEGEYQLIVDVVAGEAPMCVQPGGFCQSGPDCCSGWCHIGHCH